MDVNKNKFENDNENDYFFITFVNEKILVEQINDENNSDRHRDSLLSLICCEKRIDFEINEMRNINFSKLVYKNSFTEEVSFDSSEYIRNIYNSYKMNWENVYVQYVKDFNRQTIIIDKKIIHERQEFECFANRFQQYIFEDEEYNLNYDKLFIMLTTQSSYYFMYLYSKTFENKIRKLYNNHDVYIVNGPTKSIHFETNKEDEILFKAILTLFVKDINNDKKVFNIIHLELNITFSLIGYYTNLFNLLFNKNMKNENVGLLYSIIV